VIALLPALDEFGRRQHYGIHFPAKLRSQIRPQSVAEVTQAGLAYHQKINVAMRLLAFAGDGPEDERYLNLQRLKRIAQHIHQTGRLQHKIAQIREQRVTRRRAIAYSVSVAAQVDQTEANQPLQFLAHRREAKSRAPRNFAQMQFPFGMAVQHPEDFSFDARRKDLGQRVHTVLLYRTIVLYYHTIFSSDRAA
jgi:hypothetical protein